MTEESPLRETRARIDGREPTASPGATRDDLPTAEPDRAADAHPDATHGATARPDPDATSVPAAEAGGPGRPEAGAGVVIAGRYTLREKIGEGGMGEVWVAEQTRPVRRRVALKLIKPGMDSRAVLSRFEQERQALAMMDHPHIAKVLDGGLTAEGRPFFVMELVDGPPLTGFCDEARLTPGERLELFETVCQAVQHAHQKGVVHRDLKPANILVTRLDGRPVPKVIDFGVAKATAGKLIDESMATQFGSIVGTLEYMAPEQAGPSEVDVDTRADIYSLGVILYELLTGLRPIDADRLKKAAVTEMIRIIQEEEPQRPSTRLSTDEALLSLAEARRTEPRKLTRLLKGDLDWVVMKCLEKPRDRRYETAAALARDVRRHLDGDPVEAGPPSASYRMGKFARKHRGALATAAAFALLLLAATAVSAGLAVRAHHERLRATQAEAQARAEADRAVQAEARARADRDRAVKAEAQARTEADKARAINEFLTSDLLTQAEPEKGAGESRVTLLDVLDRAAERVGGRFADQPEVAIAVRRSIAATYHGLASYGKAERQWRAIRELARRPGADPAEAYRAEVDLAEILRHLGRADEEVLGMVRSAAEGLARRLGPAHADTIKARRALASNYLDAGLAAEAIAELEATLKAAESGLGPVHEETTRVRNFLGLAYQAAGRVEEAIAFHEATLKRLESKPGPEDREAINVRHNLAVAYQTDGRVEEAIAIHRANLEKLLKDQGPDGVDTRNVTHILAHAVQAVRPAEAEPLFRRALDAYRKTEGPDAPITIHLVDELAGLLVDLGRHAEAEPLFRELIALRRARAKGDDPVLASTLASSGSNLLRQRKWAEAEPILRECLAVRRKAQPELWTTFNAMSLLGGSLMGQKKYAEAEPLLRQGYEGMKQREAAIAPGGRLRLPEALQRLVQLAEETGRPDEAARWRRELAAAEAAPPQEAEK